MDETASDEATIADAPHLEALTAVRRQLASALVDARGKDKAPLVRELRAVLGELRQLGAGQQESPLDEIAARRAKRRAARPTGTADS